MGKEDEGKEDRKERKRRKNVAVHDVTALSVIILHIARVTVLWKEKGKVEKRVRKKVYGPGCDLYRRANQPSQPIISQELKSSNKSLLF